MIWVLSCILVPLIIRRPMSKASGQSKRWKIYCGHDVVVCNACGRRCRTPIRWGEVLGFCEIPRIKLTRGSSWIFGTSPVRVTGNI
ncbi:hypothetical protein OSB04_016426 [Centaurea solstitialis]|uniref:Secreted protein n=1 Tax=Centaurea solstitialis TaxID=347529 RepID=A0AA38WL21_9ASTR|nr:hypothetical protein OSB04_016426 [Centaurea solstitialis]